MSVYILGAGGTGNSGELFSAGNEYWYMQTFTAPEHFVLSSLNLEFVTWVGNTTGEIEVNFYNLDDDEMPTGSSLVSDTYEINWTGTTRPTWFSLGTTGPIFEPASGYAFVLGSRYAFVLKITITTIGELCTFIYDVGSTIYPIELFKSSDQGDTWVSYGINPVDIKFSIFGDIVPAGYVPPTVPFPPVRPTPDYPDPVWIVPPPYPVGPYVPPYWGPSEIYKATGGGRWNQQLVVTGDNSVWYEGLT
ncbi:MAG: hypothetical protein MUP81_04605 [Dehalococcoidia bacterium]|nr:hypothetical protein [Dehalococcoidia bacterium]